jgi:hypothetical protein
MDAHDFKTIAYLDRSTYDQIKRLEEKLDSNLRRFNLITKPLQVSRDEKILKICVVDRDLWKIQFTREYESIRCLESADSVVKEVVFHATFL